MINTFYISNVFIVPFFIGRKEKIIVTDISQNSLKRKYETLIRRLQELGIKRNCRDEYKYIQAKRVIEDLASSHSEHDRLIRIATDYIGI